jgi:hypothetical protein
VLTFARLSWLRFPVIKPLSLFKGAKLSLTAMGLSNAAGIYANCACVPATSIFTPGPIVDETVIVWR